MKKTILFLVIVNLVLINVNASLINYEQNDYFFFNKITSRGTETMEMPAVFFSTPFGDLMRDINKKISYEKALTESTIKLTSPTLNQPPKKEVSEEKLIVVNEPIEILITDEILRFEPVTVKVNQPVIWKNEQEKLQVLLYGMREIFAMKSGFLEPGESFSWTFLEPGEYTYVDSVVIGRSGKILVE